MKSVIHRISFLFLFLIWGTAFSQGVYTKRYNSESNLPSSVLYRVFSDSKKFIWISSDAGISRFDGQNFRTFTASEGMPDNEVFDISEDSSGTIWFTTLRGIVGSISNGVVQSGVKNKEIRNEFIQTVAIDREGFRWMGNSRGDIYKLRGDSIIHRWKMDKTKSVGIAQDPYGRIWVSTPQTDRLYYLEGDKIEPVYVNNEPESYYYAPRPIVLEDGNIAFHGFHFWTIVNTHTLRPILLVEEEELKDRILMCLMEDEKQNIWVGTSKGVLLYSKIGETYVLRKKFLEGERITSMTRDFEGNYWLATLSSGLCYLPCNPLTVNNYQIRGYSDNISVVLSDNRHRIWLGNDEGNIFNLSNGVITLAHPTENLEGWGRVTCACALRDGTVCMGKDNALVIIRPEGGVEAKPFSSIKAIVESHDGTIWLGTHAELVRLDPKTMTIIQQYFIGRVTALYADGRRLWFANEFGLNVLETDKPRLFVAASLLGGQRISGITKTRGLIWVSTFGSGIYGIDPKKGPQIRFHKGNGLVSDYCQSISLDKDGHIWVATKKGLNQINVDSKGTLNIFLLNHENGLAADEVNNVEFAGDTMWVASSMGVSKLLESKINYNPVPPPVYIEKFSVHGQPLEQKLRYELPFRQSQFKIELAGVSFMSGDKLMFKHKMIGLDSNWVISNSHEIHYPFLDPGQYHFVAKAVSSRGEESIESAEFFITVHPAYWQTIWFRIFVGFIIFLLVLSSIVVRIKVIKKREEEKTRLNKMLGELELTALKAQMNPHFIFNSLGSIQNLINRDKKTEANIYLSKFAKLLRMTLDHSDKREVSLADETSMLELYLGLEALRFVNKFEYVIEIDPDIDPYVIKVPPMILQPFIENAIKHGLLPKKADALLSIRFSMLDNESLYCMVEDNGIGRVQREKLKEKSTAGHISKGIKITRNRLELVNQLRSRPAEIKITDLYRETGEAAGTRIEIYIPID